MTTFSLRLADWEADQAALYAIRHEVFVVEQHVPVEEEVDAHDPASIHVIVWTADGTPVATGRLLPDGHIGRMAVRAPFRGCGLGGRVLESLVDEAARRGHTLVVLAAQTHAIPFYAAHGFRVYGPVFLDAGIEHRAMDRDPRIPRAPRNRAPRPLS